MNFGGPNETVGQVGIRLGFDEWLDFDNGTPAGRWLHLQTRFFGQNTTWIFENFRRWVITVQTYR